MAEGQYGEETFNEIEEDSNSIKNKIEPIADKGIEKGAEALSNYFQQKKDTDEQKKNNVENKKANNNEKNRSDEKSSDSTNGDKNENADSSKEKLDINKNSDGSDNANKKGINTIKNSGKATNGVGKTADGANKVADGASKAADGASKAADGASKAADAASGAADAASGGIGLLNRLNPGKAIQNAGGPGDGEMGGDVVNNVQKEVGKAVENTVALAVDAARLVATGGTDVGAWVDVIKRLLVPLLVLISIPLILIAILIFCMGGVIMEALTKMSEAFTAVSEMINPTQYENFSMEDQYEILAEAFGDEVYRAYEKMLEDIENEIDNYQKDSTYNEWKNILDWNLLQHQINYSMLYSYYDQIDNFEQGMPDADVYIGGYVGPISDSQWGNGGRTPYVDPRSKTNPNFNKGMLKENYYLTAPVYATGNEVYFDSLEVLENIQDTVGYAAVSDMAYLVSGYNVSMMEAPIIEFGTNVSSLQAGSTVLKYKIDIAERIFLNTFDNNSSKYGGGLWGNVAGFFATAGEAVHNKLAQILDGETTYFTYDPSLIEVKQETMSRTVIEYQEKIYTDIQEEEYVFHISYENEDGTHGSTTIIKYHTHEEYLRDYTHTSVPHYSSGDFVGEVESEISRYRNASIDSVDTRPVGNTYPLNRSIYTPVVKQYTKNTLDIPMSAFDVDRILKALFETSPYYGELDYYYTDRYSTYGISNEGNTSTKITSDDEILNKYGKYIDKWKYAYYDETISYTGYDGNSFSIDYVKGDIFDNGIDSQPYVQQDEVYIYTCGCDPSYGIHKTCPICGRTGLQRSKDITLDGTKYGSGERPITYLGTELVKEGLYFSCILNTFDETGSIEKTFQTVKQNTTVAITTYDKKVIDDYTGGQVGGTVNTGTTFTGDNQQAVGTNTHQGSAGRINNDVIVNISGNNNTEKTWNFLIDKGLTKEQAAGIMGNIEHESRFRTTALNKQIGGTGAYGMIQWTRGRQEGLYDYCSQNGFSPSSVEGQLNYMWYELTTTYRSSVYERILSATTVSEVTTIWGAKYEVYAFEGTNAFRTENNERIKSALVYYRNNGGEVVPSNSGDVDYTRQTNNRFTSSIEVILMDKEGREYYPITVLDRILSNKDFILNVLKNSDAIQQELAHRGLSYDQRYGTNGENSLDKLNISPLGSYISDKIKSKTSYDSLVVLSDGTYAIGIGGWRSADAIKLLRSIISNNTDLYNQACSEAGISEINFSTNFLSEDNPNSAKYKEVIRKLLGAGQSEQDTMFDEKIQKIINYLRNQHITDASTLSLLTTVAMYFENDKLIEGTGGTISQFREYVMNAGMNAGVENSLAKTYSALMNWMGNSGNEFASTTLKSKFESYYREILDDKKNDVIPWIGTGELTPGELEPLISVATSMVNYKTELLYIDAKSKTQKRYAKTKQAEMLQQIIDTGVSDTIKSDCSSFVSALYYCFGYNIPESSGSWRNNSYGYIQRNDFSNIQPGDVIVYRNESKGTGHVELYLGDGKSIGFGSERGPLIRDYTSLKGSKYPTMSYYRIVE